MHTLVRSALCTEATSLLTTLCATSLQVDQRNGGTREDPGDASGAAGIFSMAASRGAHGLASNLLFGSLGGDWHGAAAAALAAGGRNHSLDLLARFLGKAGIIPMPAWNEQPHQSAPKKKAQERAKEAAAAAAG